MKAMTDRKGIGWKLRWHRQELPMVWAAAGGVMLLATPFVSDSGMANGIVGGKVFWFHLAMLLTAAGMAATACLFRKRFPFAWTDGMLLLFAGITLFTYDWRLDPEPEQLLFGGQLVVLWFLLRRALSEARGLGFFYLLLLMAAGIGEALLGLLQLYGYAGSNHALFRLTGTFFNPGPYSGFLAVALPLCLWTVLRFEKMMQYAGWLGIALILVLLPAGMSRSAWIAAAVGCGWVWWAEKAGWEKTKAFWTRHRRIVASLLVAALLSAGCLIAGLYGIKRESADGRLLMWEVTAMAIADRHGSGTGIGGFPAAYAEAQADYFRSGRATEREQWVAGCPEYAFNEYLQIGLEQGLVGLATFLLWIGGICLYGTRNRQHGAVGSVLALAVFAASSYPLRLPAFWIVLVFLGAVCVTGDGVQEIRRRRKGIDACLLLLLAAVSTGLFLCEKGRYAAYRQWNRAQMLYNNKAYGAAVEDYASLHERLGHKPEFLFEEGQCLGKTGQHAEAVQVLERAARLSGDPMIRYMIAKNRQAAGDYAGAEKELREAIDILPERIYPHFLLVELYAEEDFYHPDKLRQAAHVVLNRTPKVSSRAIEEMREKTREILNQKEGNGQKQDN